METKAIYEATEYKNVKEIILNSAEKFNKKTAFTIKHKNKENVEYEDISYTRLLQDIYNLGTGFFNIGF